MDILTTLMSLGKKYLGIKGLQEVIRKSPLMKEILLGAVREAKNKQDQNSKRLKKKVEVGKKQGQLMEGEYE